MALTKIRGSSQILDLSIGNAQIANAAGIELTKIQDGTQLIKADGTVSFTAPVAGVLPTLDGHLATKGYVDSVATGLDVKLSVRAISTTNIALTGTQVVDGVSLIAGDRILVAGQTDETQNGIYTVAAGAWARSTDADNSPVGEVTSGMFTFVEEGGTYSGSGWVLSTANPILLGTTDLVFAQFSSAGLTNAGAGLVKVGNDINIISANGGIVVNANDIALTVDPNGTLAVTAAGIKLADLPSGQILVGDNTSVATAVTLSGDVTLDNTGVVTIINDAITTAKILNGAVTLPKLGTLTAGNIIIGTSGGNQQVAVSGDATLAQSGALTIANDAITTAKILNTAVTLAKIETLAPTEIIIGTATGNDAVVISGDATLSATGVLTIDSDIVVKVADVVTRETPTGLVNGTNPTFTLAFAPRAGTEHIYLNGLLMDEGAGNDYTIAGDTITFTFNPVSGDKIRVSYFKG